MHPSPAGFRRPVIPAISFVRLGEVFCLALLLFFGTSLPCLAQKIAPAAQRPRQVFPAQEPEDVLRIDTDLVSVDVTLTDAEGRPVRNLRKDDFKVYADGVELPVSFFQLERRSGGPRPMAIVFALDISGSM